jgi:hypothetical protein
MGGGFNSPPVVGYDDYPNPYRNFLPTPGISPVELEGRRKFDDFKRVNNKYYSNSEEETYRLSKFMDRLK